MDLGRRGRGKGLLVLEGGGGRSSGRGLSLPLLFRSLLELLLLLLLLISSLSSSSSDKELRGVLAGPAPLALDRRRRSGEEQGRGLVHLFFLSLGQEGGAPFSLGREEVKKKQARFFFPTSFFSFNPSSSSLSQTRSFREPSSMPLTLQAAAARQSALASCSSRGVAPLSPAPRGGPANGKLRRRSLLLMPPAFASAAAADSSSSSPPPPSDWDRTAVVIVDHGSRKAEANAELEEFATLYR